MVDKSAGTEELCKHLKSPTFENFVSQKAILKLQKMLCVCLALSNYLILFLVLLHKDASYCYWGNTIYLDHMK